LAWVSFRRSSWELNVSIPPIITSIHFCWDEQTVTKARASPPPGPVRPAGWPEAPAGTTSPLQNVRGHSIIGGRSQKWLKDFQFLPISKGDGPTRQRPSKIYREEVRRATAAAPYVVGAFQCVGCSLTFLTAVGDAATSAIVIGAGFVSGNPLLVGGEVFLAGYSSVQVARSYSRALIDCGFSDYAGGVR
jgi:hypothetical protein